MQTPEDILIFYKSKEWIRARDLCKMKNRYICEECGLSGDLEVHHKRPLTLDNYKDPLIALNQDNLQCLCRSCHMSKRGCGILRTGLKFTPDGQIIPIESFTSHSPPH